MTLAYLPGMETLSRNQLQKDLQQMLDTYLATRSTPIDRITDMDIMWRLHALMRVVGEVLWEDWISVPLTDLVPKQLENDLMEGNLQLNTHTVDATGDLASTVWRLYNRDVQRIRDATERAQGLPQIEESESFIVVGLGGCNVKQQCELYDLLEYFHDRLIHRHGCYYLEPVKEVGIHHRFSWHVTIDDFPQMEIHGSLDMLD